MWLVVVAALLCPVVAAQFVNHFEVLGVAENATTPEVRRAYQALALKSHPDKGGDPGAFARITEAYQALRSEEGRKAFVEELRFFRQHGFARWGLRYRVYPRTNAVTVIVGAVLVSLLVQYLAQLHHHRRMYALARETEAYHNEVARRIAEGLDPRVEVHVQGAEPPELKNLWIVRLVVLPWRLYKYFVYERPLQMEEQRKAKEMWDALPGAEKRRLKLKYARMRAASAREANFDEF